MNKFLKNTWPLWGILGVAILITLDVIYFSTINQPDIPLQGEGAFAQYRGEWIGGDIVGDKIHLTNGTIMDFNDWKEKVGYIDP